jgi:hypothetical protein
MALDFWALLRDALRRLREASSVSAYGFEVYDADGRVLYSTIDSTWTLLATYLVPANTNATISNVPIMSERIVTRQMIGELNGDNQGYVHDYSLSGTTLSMWPPDSNNTVATFFTVLGR